MSAYMPPNCIEALFGAFDLAYRRPASPRRKSQNSLKALQTKGS
jgi:hypothetical protein